VKRSTNQHRALAGAALIAATLLAGSGLTGCRGERTDAPPRQFFPGMDDNPRWDPQEQSEFYADGRTMRPRVAGTVAFGRSSVAFDQDWAEDYALERASMLKDDPRVFEGREADGSLVRDIPVEVNEALLATGKKHYEIYCAACHGYTGDGQGMVGTRWAYALPSFHDIKYIDKDLPDGLALDGHLFNIIRYGKYDAQGVQKMPGYAHAIDEHEAWGVVLYLRALQQARRASIDDVPDAERPMLLRQRGPAPAQTSSAPADGAPPAPGAEGDTMGGE